MAFVDRQTALIHDLTHGLQPQTACPEEQMLVDLIQNEPGGNPQRGGLRSYIHNMMAVMAFDAERRGRLISHNELDAYARTLAVAVTEAMHYFIGHCCSSPRTEDRYLAVTGAHITHMLRDTLDDNAAGYFNIPQEYLKANNISPLDVKSDPYRAWVRSRVQLARDYFKSGRRYMAQVENFRCRLAGYTYIARFEAVLDSIERDDYYLRAQYKECKTLIAGIRMGRSTLWSAINEKTRQTQSGALTI
jgi:phytoene/squalene synthetase